MNYEPLECLLLQQPIRNNNMRSIDICAAGINAVDICKVWALFSHGERGLASSERR